MERLDNPVRFQKNWPRTRLSGLVISSRILSLVSLWRSLVTRVNPTTQVFPSIQNYETSLIAVPGSHRNPRAPVPNLCHTARIYDLAGQLIPHVVDHQLWFDTNLRGRVSSISVKADDPHQRNNAILSFRTVRDIGAPVVRIFQALNVVQIVELFRPSGIRIDLNNPIEYVYLTLDALPLGYRALSQKELENWFDYHVLEAGFAMKYKSRAVFVRDLFGGGVDTLLPSLFISAPSIHTHRTHFNSRIRSTL